MKNKKRFRIRLLPIAILILVIVIAVIAMHSRHSDTQQSNIQTDTVKKGTVISSVSGNGVLKPITTVEVKSNVAGTIVKLAVDTGDYVKQGQLIAKIDPSDTLSTLNQAKADYESASSQVDAAKESLNMQRLQTSASIRSAEKDLESSSETLLQAQQESNVQPKLTQEAINQAKGSLESAQATLEQTSKASNPQNITSAQASYDEASATLNKAEKNLKRQKALLEKGFVSQSVVDDAQEAYAAANAQYESAKKKNETMRLQTAQDLRDAQAKVVQAQASLKTALANKANDSIKLHALKAAKANFEKAKASLLSARASVYQDQVKAESVLQAQAALKKASATLDNAKTQMGYTTIVAPRSGVVVAKDAEEGSIVSAGRQANAGSGSGVTIVELADVSKMQVEVDVDETDVCKITLGQEVDVTLDAINDELFPAKVIKIAPMAEVNSNVTTVPVTVELERTDSRLKPEMNATCSFVINRKKNVLYVPVEAITETDSGTEVTVMDKDKQATKKVQVGLIGDDYCEIISGLKLGETVIIPEEDTSSTKKNSRGSGGPPPM